jgi:hypothetical protein
VRANEEKIEMSNVIPIFAARLEAEAVRQLLTEATEAAQARLRSYDCGNDYILQYVVGILVDCLPRLPYFAAETKFWEECLSSLRYIASEEFQMNPHNFEVLSICVDIVDARYMETSERGVS